MASYIIYVEPAPKGRPKSTIIAGHVHAYTPAKTRHAEEFIRSSIMNALNYFKIQAGTPVELKVVFYIQRPKHLPKRVVLPVKKPDLDNYMKLLSDACEKYLYDNDSQITTLQAKKRFGDPPRIEIIINEDKGEDINGNRSET